MSEMVERVAKAILSAYNASNPTPVSYEQLGERGRLLAECMARAAINAMKEPTADMETAGSSTAHPEGLGSFVRGYRAAVGKALQ